MNQTFMPMGIPAESVSRHPALVRQIVYFSTASGRQDAIVTAGILAVSRDHNRREGVTGLLVAGGHRYLQVIEGSSPVIDALITRIRRDDRHVGVTVLVDRRIERRSFEGWSMAHSAEPELQDFATFRDLAGVMRAHIADRKLREQLDCFARTYATSPLRIDATPWKMASHDHADLMIDRRH
ncbi:MAG: BLUF domain-containing protein [Sphingomonas bacterium]|nr:BLUF domain-containing protein [Sphingomonas bacterium]